MYNLPLWFFNHGFEFQSSVCNGCRDLTMLYLNISDIAIITVSGVDYCCIIHYIGKHEVIHLLENSVSKKSTLKIVYSYSCQTCRLV